MGSPVRIPVHVKRHNMVKGNGLSQDMETKLAQGTSAHIVADILGDFGNDGRLHLIVDGNEDQPIVTGLVQQVYRIQGFSDAAVKYLYITKSSLWFVTFGV